MLCHFLRAKIPSGRPNSLTHGKETLNRRNIMTGRDFDNPVAFRTDINYTGAQGMLRLTLIYTNLYVGVAF